MKRRLFQLERWSPQLARKFWSLAPLLSDPLSLLLGLKINVFTDSAIESSFSVRFLPETTLLAAGEMATKTLWRRHLNTHFSDLHLAQANCEFLTEKRVRSEVRLRGKLSESDRENVLRALGRGISAVSEMSIAVFDNNERRLANLTYTWHIKPLGPLALEGGQPHE